MYKVVTSDLKSLGLRKNPNILVFPLNIWVNEPNPLKGNKDSGGIWVTRHKFNATKLLKYMKKKGIECRIFRCLIGNVLYENSYRLKTDRVMLCEEINN